MELQIRIMTRPVGEHDGRQQLCSEKSQLTKSKRWPVSIVVLAVDEHLETGDSVENCCDKVA